MSDDSEPSRYSLVVERTALIDAERKVGLVFSIDRAIYEKTKRQNWKHYWTLAHDVEKVISAPSSIFTGLNRDGFNDESSLCYAGRIDSGQTGY